MNAKSIVLVVRPLRRNAGARLLAATAPGVQLPAGGCGGAWGSPAPLQPRPPALPVAALWFLLCACLLPVFLSRIGKGKMKLHDCAGSGNKVGISECAPSLGFF